MKKYIDSPILVADSPLRWFNWFVSRDENWNWCFCSGTILRVFNLPEKVRKIQFRVYTEPGPDRLAVKFTTGSWVEIEDYVDGPEVILQDVFDSEVKPLLQKLSKRRKTFYVKVFYWE